MGDHLPRRPHPARLHHLIPPQPKHSPLINHLATQNLGRPLARLSHVSLHSCRGGFNPPSSAKPKHAIILELTGSNLSSLSAVPVDAAPESSAGGAEDVSPARKCWVRNPEGPQAP